MRCVAGVCRDSKLTEIDRKVAEVLQSPAAGSSATAVYAWLEAGTGTWSADPAAVTISTPPPAKHQPAANRALRRARSRPRV